MLCIRSLGKYVTGVKIIAVFFVSVQLERDNNTRYIYQFKFFILITLTFIQN